MILAKIARKIKYNASKKESGVIGQLLPSLLTLFVVFFLLMTYINMSKAIEKKNAMDVLARQYIIRMETYGKLTESDRDDLKAQLESLGCANIDFTGTSLTEVGYGNTVVLCIKGTMPIGVLSWLDGLDTDFSTNMVPFSIYKASTGKY